MFLLAGGIQFGPPCLEWYNEKTKTCSLDVRKKSEKVKILSKLFLQLPIRRQKCRFYNKAANFPPQIRHFLAQSRKLFHKVNILFLSMCSAGHLKCLFDDSVEKFRQSSKSFGSKCIFDDCWNISAGSSINFAWKTKLNWKTNTFLIKTPQKVLGTLKMQFQQKRRIFFSKLIFFSPESEVKKNMRTIHKKKRKSPSDT